MCSRNAARDTVPYLCKVQALWRGCGLECQTHARKSTQTAHSSDSHVYTCMTSSEHANPQSSDMEAFARHQLHL